MACRGLRNSIIFRGIYFDCSNGGAILSSVSLCTGPNRGVTFINSANTNGAAVAGLLGHFCRVRGKGVHCSKVGVRGVYGNSLHSSLSVILRSARLFANAVRSGVHCNGLSTARRRIMGTTGLTGTSSFVAELPSNCSAIVANSNTGLDRKRERLVTVTETTITSPPILILSRTADSVSAHARRLVRGNVSGLVGNEAAFIVTRHLSAMHGTSTVVILRRNGVVRHNDRSSLVGRRKGCCRLCANRFRLSWWGSTIFAKGRHFRPYFP